MTSTAALGIATALAGESTGMGRFVLAPAEVDQVRSLLDDIVLRFPSAESPEFLREATVCAQELPRRLRLFLNDFRLLEPEPGCCLVSGWPVDDHKIGDTPRHWKHRVQPTPTFPEEAFLVLVGSLLGEPIAWATQQAGFLIHDIFPILGNEKEQLGTGSEETLTWHTEDAFHPCSADFLALLCLRNHDGIATTWGNLDAAQLSPGHREILFQPRYTIRPDESHLQKNSACPVTDAKLGAAYSQIQQMDSAPAKIAVLFGSRDRPYLRIDPYFMDPLADDPEAQAALDAVIAVIDSRMDELVGRPGDIFVIDNFRVVHGRNPFKARYDGRDRWLKRLNIARDLRKSRELRMGAESRAFRG
ncbi:MAG TPA: guanitoxin biosynthesis L-enduracididine beta-hydroxylase GntD [Thermoanaerobaculia bacterium]|jgi:Fe(II)/alpha-ketoglutarate-dependent arginine beta-hydroxylase|nr:guanitoxin biosynthesis L-enduracididine beta-hydroxylase GntD [Thermoanaerobaculia bacterium]